MRHEHRRPKPRSASKLLSSADEGRTGPLRNSSDASRGVGHSSGPISGTIQNRSGPELFLFASGLPPAPDRYLLTRASHQRDEARRFARPHGPLGNEPRSLPAPLGSVRLRDVAVRPGGPVGSPAGCGVRSLRVMTCRSALLILILLSACARRSRFLERSVTLGDHEYRYRVWLPPHYTKLHHWPVILYLHGSGERGDDNLRQVAMGLGPALERFSDRYKSVIVFPQCQAGQEW